MTRRYWLDGYGKVQGPDGRVPHAELNLPEGYVFVAQREALELLSNAGGHTKTFHGWRYDSDDGNARFTGLCAAFQLAVAGFRVHVHTPAGRLHLARVLAGSGLWVLSTEDPWYCIDVNDFCDPDQAQKWEGGAPMVPE